MAFGLYLTGTFLKSAHIYIPHSKFAIDRLPLLTTDPEINPACIPLHVHLYMYTYKGYSLVTQVLHSGNVHILYLHVHVDTRCFFTTIIIILVKHNILCTYYLFYAQRCC